MPGLKHSDLWIENNFWEIWQIFTKLFILKLCVFIFLFLLRNVSDTKKEQRIIQQAPMYLQLSFSKNTFLIQVEEAPGISPPSSYSHPSPLEVTSALGWFSSPGFLYTFNTYANIFHNLGFSFACSRFILLVSYCMYSLVTFLFFFCSIELVKFIHVGML